MSPPGCAAGALLLVLLGASTAVAAPVVVQRGPGAATCPDADALWGRAVAQGAGTPAVGGFVVEMDGAPDGGLRATVRRTDGDTEPRRLHDLGPGCEVLADAVAVAMALASPRPAAGPRGPEGGPHRGPTSGPPGREPGPSWRGQLALGGGLTAGLTDALGAEAALGAAVARGPYSLGLDLALNLPRTIDAGPGSARLTVTSAGVRACGRVLGSDDGVALAGCLGPTLRLFTAQGRDLAENRSVSRFSPAALGAVQVQGPLGGSFGWSARLEGFVPLRRETLSVEGVGEIHQTPAAGLAVLAQLWWAMF